MMVYVKKTPKIKIDSIFIQSEIKRKYGSVKYFIDHSNVGICAKTLYRSFSEGQMSQRTFYRVCSTLSIDPKNATYDKDKVQQPKSNWDVGKHITECKKCNCLYSTNKLMSIGFGRTPSYCPSCGCYMGLPMYQVKSESL